MVEERSHAPLTMAWAGASRHPVPSFVARKVAKAADSQGLCQSSYGL